MPFAHAAYGQGRSVLFLFRAPVSPPSHARCGCCLFSGGSAVSFFPETLGYSQPRDRLFSPIVFGRSSPPGASVVFFSRLFFDPEALLIPASSKARAFGASVGWFDSTLTKAKAFFSSLPTRGEFFIPAPSFDDFQHGFFSFSQGFFAPLLWLSLRNPFSEPSSRTFHHHLLSSGGLHGFACRSIFILSFDNLKIRNPGDFCDFFFRFSSWVSFFPIGSPPFFFSLLAWVFQCRTSVLFVLFAHGIFSFAMVVPLDLSPSLLFRTPPPLPRTLPWLRGFCTFFLGLFARFPFSPALIVRRLPTSRDPAIRFYTLFLGPNLRRSFLTLKGFLPPPSMAECAVWHEIPDPFFAPCLFFWWGRPSAVPFPRHWLVGFGVRQTFVFSTSSPLHPLSRWPLLLHDSLFFGGSMLSSTFQIAKNSVSALGEFFPHGDSPLSFALTPFFLTLQKKRLFIGFCPLSPPNPLFSGHILGASLTLENASRTIYFFGITSVMDPFSSCSPFFLSLAFLPLITGAGHLTPFFFFMISLPLWKKMGIFFHE